MIHIGVTGHRFLAEIDKVTVGVDEALRQIEAAFPGQPWTVVSALAEGADRLVLRRARARAHGPVRLVVPLPLPPRDYAADFTQPGAGAEFLALLDGADEVIELPPAPTHAQAYAVGAYYLLDRCDVLVALWDGQEAQGRGGTGDVVGEARRRGLPVAWVHVGNRRPGTAEAITLGTKQGRVTLERFPNQAS